MERLGLSELFPRGAGAFGCERESRIALFDLARERAGNWPGERTVAVGDTPLDVSSAHAAGCRCIGLTTGSYGREALADADAVISDLGELKAQWRRSASSGSFVTLSSQCLTPGRGFCEQVRLRGKAASHRDPVP
jgi:phosphoglycolate phosphatase-like HAD superfamily hydrolase